MHAEPPPATGSFFPLVTRSFADQAAAAAVLSAELRRRGIAHAYIGGFAWAMLGSERPTQDIDVLVEVRAPRGGGSGPGPGPGAAPAAAAGSDSGDHAPLDIRALRRDLAAVDPRFAGNAVKFYYINDPAVDISDPEERLRRSTDTVMIETLVAGQIGLPTTATPLYEIPDELNGDVVPILHPSVLILTKLKRWYHMYLDDSTHPKTLKKMRSDENDLRWMLCWLVDNGLRVEPGSYEGKPRADLLRFLRGYHACFPDQRFLRDALHAADWEEMLALPAPVRQSCLPPPEDEPPEDAPPNAE